MKSNTPFLFFIAILLLAGSCKKSGASGSGGTKDSTGSTSSGCQLLDRKEGNLDYTYSYNTDGTVSGIAVAETGLFPWSAAYSYAGDSTIISVNNNGNKYKVFVRKNSQKQITNLFYEYYDVTGAAISWTNYVFT